MKTPAARRTLLAHSAAAAVALLVLTLPPSTTAQAQQHAASTALSAQQIVERALDTNNLGFQTGEATVTMIIQDVSGSTRERRMLIRGVEENDESRTLVRVLAPAEVAGQSYLFREQSDGEDEVYIYLPALDTGARRIAGRQKSGAFMGSHFSYSDLESRSLRDGHYTRLPDEKLAGFDVFVVDVTPADGDESEDARVRIWIRQSDFIPLRVRFFDAQGNTRRTLFIEELAKNGDETYVRRMSLRPEAGGATTMIIEDLDADAQFDASTFSPQQLAN